MSDKITTLHLKNDPSTNVYPNVKIENIPLDVTITSDGENLAKTKTIYEFTTSKFLSLDGGTMNGKITINDIDVPEKTILGDGVEVIEASNPANPATHYGCGYIRQDDDEDTSINYHYKFPKKNGTFALDDILNLQKRTENFESFFTKTIDEDGNFNFDLIKTIPNGLYIYHPEPNIISYFEFEQYITILVFGRNLNGKLNDLFDSITPYPNPTTGFGFSENNQYEEYYIYVIGSIIYIDIYWEL